MLASETEAAILSRVIGAGQRRLSPEAAQELLRLGFSEDDHRRMQHLSDKAAAGDLSPTEREEFEGFINVSHFLALMHSRARMSLRDHA